MPPRIGDTLANRYSLVEQLGAGGMGVVYRGHDSFLKRDVAIKLVPPDRLTEDSRKRFLTEAQIVAGMDHPSIVPVYDFGEHDGSMFFVMPVVAGQTLAQLLRQRELTLGEAIEVVYAVADALAFAHKRGIIHRDIKPENIMVAVNGDNLRVRVMDFGLARRTDAQHVTQVGVLVGTLNYLSPEQVSGRPAGAASDLYALGTVFYECLVRELPFSGPTDSLLYRIVNEYPMPLRERGLEIDEGLEALVLRCLAKEPLDRPESAKVLAELLRRYLRDSSELEITLERSTEIRPRRPSDAMIGRDKQMASLQLMLNHMLAGHGQVCVIAGDEGVGKTRLAHAFAKFASARGVRPLHGRLLEHEGAFPYFGFGTLILEFFRTLDGSSTGAPRPDLGDLAPRLAALFPMLGELEDFRLAHRRDTSPSIHPREELTSDHRIKLYELLAMTFSRLAAVRPLLLVFEDLHLADSSVQALQYIARRIGSAQIMMVLTYRADAVDRRHPFVRMLHGFRGETGFTRLLLRSFSVREQEIFLQRLLGGAGVDPKLTKRLYEIAEGNPFFTKELVLALRHAGDIGQNDHGMWTAVDGLTISSEAMPATVQQAVRARIERLDSEDRRVLSAASVLGKSFQFGDLEVVVRLGDALEDVIERLLDGGLIEEERRSRSDRLSFTSGIVREVLYGELTRRRRRRLHRQYAQHIEDSRKGRLDQVYAQLFYHYAAADIPDKAMSYGLLHTRQLLDAYNAEEAIRVCRAALEFVDEDEGGTEIEGHLRECLATGLHAAGNKDAALREVGRAIVQFQACGDHQACLRAVAFAAQGAWETRKTDQARRYAEQGLALAGELGVREVQVELLTLAATLASIRGEHAQAVAYLKQSEQCQEGPVQPATAAVLPSGGHLVVGQSEPFVGADDPSNVRFIRDAELAANVFEPLMTTDERGHLVPHLCERWEVGDDGRTFLLHIRPGVSFHNGVAMQAREVVASLERLTKINADAAQMVISPIVGVAEFISGASAHISGLQVRDARTVAIALTRPLPIYLSFLSLLQAAIVHCVDSDEGPVLSGTGPFMLKSHATARMLLTRNPNYWSGRPARIETVEFCHVGDSSEMRQRLLLGDIDIASELHPTDVEGLLRDPGFEGSTIEEPEKLTFFLVFNTQSSAVGKLSAVRKALCGVVDTQRLIWQTLGRYGLPASGVLPPGVLGHDSGWRTQRLSVEAAVELLEGEVSLPLRLRVMVHPVILTRYRSVVDELFSVWQQVGVEVSLCEADMEVFDASWSNPDGIDLMIARWGGGMLDPDYFTHNLFHSEHGMLRSYYHCEASDELLEQGRAARDPQRRVRYYREFEELLRRDSVLLPLFHAVDIRVASPGVVGARLGGAPPFLNYASLAKQNMQVHRVAWAGGVVRVPMQETIDAIEPAFCNYAPYFETMGCIFETLTRIGEGGRVLPWLAKTCEAVDGGKAYRLELRDDVRFHDGRPLRSRDVRYTIERMLACPDVNDRRMYAAIRGARELIDGEAQVLSGVVIHSPTTFTIELEQPLSYFPGMLAHRMLGIVPEGSQLGPGKDPEAAIGTGPFRVVSFEPHRRLRLERNLGYWRPGIPKCQELEFYFNVGERECVDGFRKGLFSLVSELSPAEHAALLRDPELARGYHEVPALSTYYTVFNCHHGPLKDPAQRRRLIDAIHATSYLGSLNGRLARPAHSLIPPGLLGHDADRGVRIAHALSPDESPTLQPLSLVALAHPAFSREFASVLRRIVTALEQVGIHLEINEDVSEWRDRPKGLGSFDLMFSRWYADYIDSHSFAQLLLTKEGYLGPLCGTAELDALISQGQMANHPQTRHRIYAKIEDILREQARFLPLFNEQTYRFLRPEFRGLRLSIGRLLAYEELELRPKE